MSDFSTATPKRAAAVFAATLALAFVFAGSEASAAKVCNASGNTCIHTSKPDRGGVMFYYLSMTGTSPITTFHLRTKSGQQVEIATHSASAFSAVSKSAKWNGVKPGSRYTVSIQACLKRFLSSSSCSSWRAVTFTVPG